MLQKLATGLIPVFASGEIEWAANQLENGGWVLTLLNNKGQIKPQHGMFPTDHSQSVQVTLRSAFHVKQSSEWMTGAQIKWTRQPRYSEAKMIIPAAAVRLVELQTDNR
jgi:hypothetical protein